MRLLSPLALLLAACGSDAPAPDATPAAFPPPPPRPPVVVITLDTTRADRIGCYGYEHAETPNIDALAARGTRFARAYAPVPLTIPSHATLFTGLLPPSHGLRDNGDQRLSDQAVTLAEHLDDAGWRAAIIASISPPEIAALSVS